MSKTTRNLPQVGKVPREKFSEKKFIEAVESGLVEKRYQDYRKKMQRKRFKESRSDRYEAKRKLQEY